MRTHVLQGSITMDPVRGKCQRKRHLIQSQPQVDNTPLPINWLAGQNLLSERESHER